MGGAKAHYDGIVAFSQTDFTPDLKKITVPTQVTGYPHGMITTNTDRINADILAFIQS